MIAHSIEFLDDSVEVSNFDVEHHHNYYVGQQDDLVHNKPVTAYPSLKGKVFVCHVVERQVLKRYPGLFKPGEFYVLEN